MNKMKSVISLSLCMATVLSMASITANADDSVKYGTMDIPYAEFYANEGIGYEVDAVASATTSKWKNVNLTAGTYNQPNVDENGEEDGTGTILGVTYYVALTDETLEALGENNYNFTEIDEVPSAYKEVTISEDGVEFSAVKGETTDVDATATISTSSVWGDYIVDVTSTEENALSSDIIGTTYGVILTTENGDNYALRHLENIWRGEFAWSCGITTQEPHGSTLSYENFVGLSGQTIDTITYITEKGYYVVDTDLYVPKKFENTLEVATANINDGSTTITTTGFPDDYVKTYSIEGLDAEFTDDTISFNNANPGLYTILVSDKDGVYADVTTTFVLTTDVIPVTTTKDSIVKKSNATDEDFANYMANLSSVTVNGTTYSASGRGSVQIINEDGTINLDASTGKGEEAVKIFSEDGNYTLVLNSYGYNTPVQLMVNISNNAVVGASENLRGDINYDGEVNAIDLLLLKKYILGIITW